MATQPNITRRTALVGALFSTAALAAPAMASAPETPGLIDFEELTPRAQAIVLMDLWDQLPPEKQQAALVDMSKCGLGDVAKLLAKRAAPVI